MSKDGATRLPWLRRSVRMGASALLAATLATVPIVGSSAAYAADDSDASSTASQQYTDEQLLTPINGKKADVATAKKSETVDSSADDSADDNKSSKVTIIVELEETTDTSNPFTQLFGMKSMPSHDSVRQQIQSLVDDAVDDGLKLYSNKGKKQSSDVVPVADYYHVIDGFAIKAPKSLVDDIKNLDGVKNAFVQHKYSVPEDQESEGAKNQSSLDMTGADESDYTGAGQTIAIVDSGLQTNHEAFTGDMDQSTLNFSEDAIKSAESGLTHGGASAKYVNNKIVYAYDYADGDDEVTPGGSADLSHGTHVAGIAAANGGEIRGTAPDAQIMMFKVCDDTNGSIYDTTLLAALDDLAQLNETAKANGGKGVSALNMSLGSDAGFGNTDANPTYAAAMQKLEDGGIVCNVAAGNAYNAAFQNNSGSNLPYATDPDAGIISSPASFSSSFAVASVNNAEAGDAFLFGDTKIAYQAISGQGSAKVPGFDEVEDGSYQVVDGGTGLQSEADAISEKYNGDLSGKVVLVKRGGTDADGTTSLTFRTKIERYQDMKPAAVIIYDNVAETSMNFGVDADVNVPAVAISLADGLSIIDAANSDSGATITVKAGTKADAATFGNYTMSDFSSWGTTPEGAIKPEITAPGGNIYSSLSGSSTSYGYMSGTSMATPQMTGISADVAQYVNSDSKFASLTDAQKRDMVTQLLMSTAKPMDEPGDASYYSPREQGAGLADVNAATSTPVYLSVEGATNANRPKADLGESSNGTWTFTVKLHNVSDQEASYTPDAHAISDTVSKGLFQQDSKDWTGKGISVSYGGSAYNADTNTVTVAANSEAEYTVTVTCDDEFISWAKDNTPNGTFVEGFAKLTAASDNAVDLSTPFCGFYGDWDAVPATDSDLVDGDTHAGGNVLASSNSGLPLGINPLDTNVSNVTSTAGYASYIDKNKYVTSNTTWSSSPSDLSPMTTLMRNLNTYAVSYKNSDGKEVKSYSYDFARKSYYYSSAGYIPFAEQWVGYPSFDGTDADGKALSQGTYTLEQSFTTAGADNGTQTKETTFTYDTQKPVISDIEYEGEGDDRTVSFKVTDNSWLASIQFNDPETGGYFYRKLADDTNGDGSHTNADGAEEYTTNEDGTKTWSFRVKLSDLKTSWDSYDTGQEISNQVNVYAWDYGLNGSSASKITINQVNPTKVTVSADKDTLYTGQSTQLSTSFEPDGVTETDLDWTSSDDSVASVSADGTVKALKAGKVTITAASKADSSVKGSVELTVSDVPAAVGIAFPENDMTLAFDNEATITALVAPDYADDTITWTSSDTSAFTVESSDGASVTLKACSKSKDATLTAVLTHDGQEYTAQMTVKVRQDDYADFDIREVDGQTTLVGYYGYRSNVTIPDNVERISDAAFAQTSPTHVTVSANVKRIDDQVFAYMPNLETVTFEDTEENPSQLTQIGSETFWHTLKLTEVTFPSKLTKLGTKTFYESAATKCVMPESLRVIPDDTFDYCSMSDVTISDRVTKIGAGAFAGNYVTEIKLVGTAQGPNADGSLPTGLPSSLVTIGNNAFGSSKISEFILPDGVTTVGDGAFQSASASKIVLNDGLKSVGKWAFQGCGNITGTFTIPDSVTTVGAQAFAYMSNVEKFTLSRNIEADQLDNAFIGCSANKEFEVPEDTANYTAIDGALFNKDATKLVSINEGAVDGNNAYTVPDTVVDIASYAFAGTDLRQVNFDENLRTIGSNAFVQSSLTSVTLPEKFETIEGNAFQNCQGIKSVDLGGTQTIGGYAFYNNQGLSDLNMRPDLNRLTTIKAGAFTECNSITEFDFPDSVTTISGMSMINMPNLTKVHIGAGLTSPLSGTFTGDNNLREITVSEDNPVYHATDNVLYGVMSEEQDPEYPGKHLFLSLPTNTFSEYTVEDGTVMIDAQAFRNNTSLTKVTLPEGLKKLDTGAFNNCSNLKDINFPDSLEYVTGLYSTTSLTTVDFGTKIKEIADNAFMGDLPSHIIVRGGQDGKFTDSMDFSGQGYADTAYFGSGMTDINFTWTEAPKTLVVPGDVKALNIKSPSGTNINDFTVYVPAGTSGEEVVKAALKSNGISESHISDYETLAGTLAVGTPGSEGDDDSGDTTATTYTVPITWYKSGTDEESSAARYLGTSSYITYAGNNKYKVMFSSDSLYASWIKAMTFDGQEMEKDGTSFVVTLTKAQLQGRQTIGFTISNGDAINMTQEAEVEFDSTAVNNMISDVEANQNGTNGKQYELKAAEGTDADASVTAGGTVTTGESTDVYVKSTGGVKGAKEYRFIEVAPDGTTTTLQNWSTKNTYKWMPVESGATLQAEVRDATQLTAETAGVVRALDAAGQAADQALNDMIASAESVKQANHTSEAFATLQQAIEAAQQVADKDNATTDDLTSAVDALQQAIDTFRDSNAVVDATKGAAWYKQGTYGTDDQVESMVSRFMSAVKVSGPNTDGTYDIDLTLTDSAAGMMDKVALGDTEAQKTSDNTYRISVAKEALFQPITVSFTYTAGQAGQMTHAADLVLGSDDAALAAATVTSVPTTWLKTNSDDSSMTSAYMFENAKVRAVGDAYYVDFTTNAPELLTNMRVGSDEAESLGNGTYRLKLTKDQLEKRTSIGMYVTAMKTENNDGWTAADASFDADAVKTAVAAAESDAAVAAIAVLPDADAVTADDAAAVQAAQKAYAALSDSQKTALSDTLVNRLNAAGAAYAKSLMSAITSESSDAEVEAAKAAYDALTDEAKDQISAGAYQKLQEGVAAVEKRAADKKAQQEAEQAAADKAAADKVTARINALAKSPTQKGIDQAKKAYSALTAAQKKLVGNYASIAKAQKTVDAANAAAQAAKAKKQATVTVNVKTVTASAIAKAVKKAGSSKAKVTTIVLGSKVKTVKAKAFKAYAKVKTITVKSKKLTKKGVKNALKGSKVTTVKVNVSSKAKTNKKYVKKYKKIFTKANAGKKVTVKAGK